MAQQTTASAMNNFTAGLKTEFTGLNFPENAATDADNCEFTLIGDVNRRKGFNYEENFNSLNIDRTDKAISSYRWNNVNGDGSTQIVVTQVGSTLYFYKSSAATNDNPLSDQLLASTVSLEGFKALDSTAVVSKMECEYTDGNGYLFVFNPACDPVYCSFLNDVITPTKITISIRDFLGVLEPDVPINFRFPTASLTEAHLYNLTNQGWSLGSAWTATSSSIPSYNNTGFGYKISTGTQTFSVATGLTINTGDRANVVGNVIFFDGSYVSATIAGYVNSYIGNVLSINIDSVIMPTFYQTPYTCSWNLYTPTAGGLLGIWNTATNNYPSNADVWWRYKDETDTFNPGVMNAKVTPGSTAAPKGSYIIQAFNQLRNTSAGTLHNPTVSTTVRPRTGCWFQGRVWYTGVDASTSYSGTVYTWSETIYFSQIIVSPSDFGKCYQTNDPSSQDLFDLLPTDGGTITIQGCGAIYKLFAMQNGLLVFAANGVWFITGSQGIGFSANDYTITKIASIQAISSSSFVDVQGLPYFWNEDGIYSVQPQQGGGLSVQSVTFDTLQSFYDEIPFECKKHVKVAYHPIDYIIQWVYRDTDATTVTDRYKFNKILNYNVYNKSFYPYSIDNTNDSISSINYVVGPGGSNSPLPVFKYLTLNDTSVSFAEEYDETYLDWGDIDYNSYFVTGYHLGGKALRLSQPQYVFMFSRQEKPTSYTIQGIWDYANDRNSGRWSNKQLITNGLTKFGMIYRKHRIRGHGLALQLKVASVSGKPFDIMGWTMSETVNAGV